MSTTDGSRNTMNNVWTANYYVQKYQGTNQYSWYFYNTHSSSYCRNGRLKFNIIWTTGHASGVGEAEYSVAYTVPHSGGTIDIRRCTRFHQWSIVDLTMVGIGTQMCPFSNLLQLAPMLVSI